MFAQRTRTRNTDEAKRKYFLVYEGKETEEIYFESVSQNRSKIGIAVLYHVSTDYLLGFQVSNRTLDVSRLTRAEYTMIADLVESMSEKNKKLEDM